jgi:hypothetical protein
VKVEVYIRNKEIEVPCVYPSPTISLSGNLNVQLEVPIIYKKIREMPEEDKKVLEIAKKIAGFEQIKVYDVCRLSGRILAKIKNVKEFPAIFVDGKKIDWKNFQE